MLFAIWRASYSLVQVHRNTADIFTIPEVAGSRKMKIIKTIAPLKTIMFICHDLFPPYSSFIHTLLTQARARLCKLMLVYPKSGQHIIIILLVPLQSVVQVW